MASLVRLGVLGALWGSGFLWVKLALRGLTPTQIVFAQLAAGAFVLLVAALRSAASELPRDPAVWGHLAVMALVANITPYLLYGWAQQHVTSSLAGTLNATTPIFTLLLALATGSERFSPTRVLGVLLAFGGVLLLVAPSGSGSAAGIAACLAAPLCFAISYVYARRFLTGRGSPLVLAAAQLSAATVLLGMTAPLFLREPPRLTPVVAGSILALGVLSTGIAYVLNYRLIQDVGATGASAASYLVPVVAVLLGVLVLDEPLTWHLLAGALTVLTGVTVIGRGRSAALSGGLRSRRSPCRE